MSATSVLPALIDAVVATLSPLSVSVSGLVVVDGLDPSVDLGQLALIIGVDVLVDEDAPLITAQPAASLSWGALGKLARDENGSIPCVVLAWGGDSLSIQRQAAIGVLNAADAALKAATANPWLGVPGALFGGVMATSLRQGYTAEGAEVNLPFMITYRARV